MSKRFGIFLLTLLPGACHYEFTAPALWAHNSSAAFEAWLACWVVAILLPLAVLFYEEPKKP